MYPSRGVKSLLAIVGLSCFSANAAEREESFDHEPSGWEGVNNRGEAFEAKLASQDFGYNATSHHAGQQPGEIGGRINPAGETAYYAWALPHGLDFRSPISAEGRLYVAPGPGHCLFGFFQADTLEGWRSANVMAIRINGRGDSFHCHIEYGTSRWRAGAGVIGEIAPGERINAKDLKSGQTYPWKLEYDPAKARISLQFGEWRGDCEIPADHLKDGIALTHFGLMPVLKTWDNAGEIWLDDLRINGKSFDFDQDPGWQGLGNRRDYLTKDTRPKFDFGWSATRHASGRGAGELGGLIFRGDCREPSRMACYGDKLEPLSLNQRLLAKGKVAVLRAISDSTASIGFYHSVHSMKSNASQKQAIPMDFLGINIEGPSSEGFYFYPVIRAHGDAAHSMPRGAPRIYPDGRAHDWTLLYTPEGGVGHGQITVTLDGESCSLNLDAGLRELGASFDRFGLCTPWVDGNSVMVYFDDLRYTCSP